MRFVVLGVLAAAFGVAAGGHGDWDLFVDAGRAMAGSDGLEVFVRHHDVQIGPLGLAAAWLMSWTPRKGFVLCGVVIAVLGVRTMRSVEAVGRAEGQRDDDEIAAATLIGGVIVVFWWSRLGGMGHLDDALVLCSAVVAARFAQRGRPWPAAVLLGLCLAVKPWAVMFLPMTIGGRCAPGWRRLLPPFGAAAIGAALWAPFILTHPDTLDSIRPSVKVAADSVIQLFGVDDANLPSWMRAAQLLGAMSVATLAMWRAGPLAVPLAAIGVRIATDPGTWDYYTVGLMIAALLWDVGVRRTIVPWLTMAMAALLLPAWVVPWENARAWMRLVACAGAVALTLRRAPANRVPSADDLDAQPVLVP